MLLAYFVELCKNIIRKEVINMVKNRIRELRKSMSISQEALAEVIHTTQQAVSRMENHA